MCKNPVVTTNAGVVISVNYPSKYRHHENCTMKINVGSPWMRIAFLDFEVNEKLIKSWNYKRNTMSVLAKACFTSTSAILTLLNASNAAI